METHRDAKELITRWSGGGVGGEATGTHLNCEIRRIAFRPFASSWGESQVREGAVSAGSVRSAALRVSTEESVDALVHRWAGPAN